MYDRCTIDVRCTVYVNVRCTLGVSCSMLDRCTMYVAVTDQEPEIKANPHSGIYEHTGYVWMPMIDAINTDKLPKFLEPAVDYAYDLVRSSR